MLKFLDRIVGVLQTSLRNIAVLGAATLLIMTIDITVDVVGRATGKAVVGTTEFNAGMVAICIFLGIGYAQTSKKHLRVTVITSRLPKTVAAVLECLVLVI